jgi:type VI secretion system secreted protein VgrG
MAAASTVVLACAALPDGIVIHRVRGEEAINDLPRWEVELIAEDGAIDLDQVAGASATLALVDALEGTQRVMGFVVADASYDGEGRDGHHYSVRLSPAEWLLTLRSGYRIFLDKTTQEIVAEVLKDAGIPAAQIKWRLSGASYMKRPHTTQYDETAWAFITRLLADEGISYWFDFADEKPLLVLGDDIHAHEGITGSTILPYADASGMMSYRHLSALEVAEQVTTTLVHVRDYDVRAPDVFIDGKTGTGPSEYFEYPACVLNSAAAAARAKVRLEQLQRFKVEARGSSDCIRVAPGKLFAVEGCADEPMNQKYLVVRVEHAFAIGAQNDATGTGYRNHLVLVPAGPAAFRPPVPKDLPKIEGVEPAFTTGPAGQEIHVDDLARLKIRFPWDRANITDDKSSYWVRSLQMSLGQSMLLPRVGWEVPVAYIDGNPDRPFVLGRLYNATAVVPYGLPAGHATTTLQSATSPGGGSTNEIRMGDTGGGMEMFLHASKDQSVTVGGSATSSVSVNETHDVGLALKLGITGSQSLTVGAKQSVDVATDYATEVAGSRTEMVGGLECIKVTGNRYVSAKGGYTELIGALYAIQCNQSNTGAKGSFTQLIGGSMNLACALGQSESVAGARTELVGGSKSFLIGSGMADSVTGAFSLTAGATKENAGGAIGTESKAAGTVKVGGSANLKAGGLFTITAPSISIKVSGSLTAKALKLGGGTLKVTDGNIKLKGTIKRQGDNKVNS